MLSIQIRLATVSEKFGLEALQLRASLENEGDRPHLLANPGIIDLPVQQIQDGHVFVAERNSSILGFAALLCPESGCIELDGLFVEPEHWRQGVGRALVDHVISHCKLVQTGKLMVVANTHAKDFYLSMGFEIEGIVETKFDPALAMTLIIARS